MMNIKFLIGFQKYLADKNKGLNGAKEQDLLSLSSIFSLYSSEFKEYVEEEGLMDSFDSNHDGFVTDEEFSKSIAGLDATQTEETTTTTQATQKAEGAVANTNSNIKASTADIKTSFNFLQGVSYNLSDDDFQMMSTLFDTNTDGILSDDEKNSAKSLLSSLDGEKNDLSTADLNSFQKYITSLNKAGLSEEDIVKRIKGLDGNENELSSKDFDVLKQSLETGIQPNSVMEAAGAGNIDSSSSSGGLHQAASAEKAVDNMSIEDLEKELETSKAATEQANQAYMQELKNQNSELAGKLETVNGNIESTQGELDTANTNLANYNSELSGYNTSLSGYKSDMSNAESRVSQIGGNISSLSSSKKALEDSKNSANSGTEEGSKPDIDVGAINSQIEAINSQIETLEAEKKTLEEQTIPGLQKSIDETQGKIDETQGKINELNSTTIPGLQKKLEDYTTESTKIQEEIDALAQSNPDLQAKLDAYNKALQYQNTVESTLEKRKADKAKAEKSDVPSVDEGPRDYSDKSIADSPNLPLTYTLGDKEYHCVGFQGCDTDGDGKVDFKPDSWEEAQRYLLNAGLTNTGKYGSMQCHNYSNVLVDLVMGTANTDISSAVVKETEDPNFGNSDTAGLYGSQGAYNPRDCVQCKAKDRDEERAIIENELKNGRPCLVSVPWSGGCHWVVAVGMSDDGDILIWDSYNGSMQKLGRTSNSDNTSEHRNMATGNGIMVLAKGYSYQYGTHGYVDYWSDVVGQTPEYTIAQDQAYYDAHH